MDADIGICQVEVGSVGTLCRPSGETGLSLGFLMLHLPSAEYDGEDAEDIMPMRE